MDISLALRISIFGNTKPDLLKFSLCVDDFGIKYYCKSDAEHLLNSLRCYYNITTDWTGEHYLGLTIKWAYHQGHVDISMPGYITKVLHKFHHLLPSSKASRPQHAPHKWTEPVYGKTRQYTIEKDTDPLLHMDETKIVQQIMGNLLYYARAIESPMLPTLNEIQRRNTVPTQNTLQKCCMV